MAKNKGSLPRIGSTVFKNIKSVLKALGPYQQLTKKDLIKKMEMLKDEYKEDFSSSFYTDLERFIRYHLGLIQFEKKGSEKFYSLTQKGIQLRQMLSADEEAFKLELFKHCFKRSKTYFSRFSDVVRELSKIHLSGETEVTLERINRVVMDRSDAKTSLGLLRGFDILEPKESDVYEIVGKIFLSRVLEDLKPDMAKDILKAAMDKRIDKTLPYEEALEIITRELVVSREESEEILKKLEIQCIIRKVWSLDRYVLKLAKDE